MLYEVITAISGTAIQQGGQRPEEGGLPKRNIRQDLAGMFTNSQWLVIV